LDFNHDNQQLLVVNGINNAPVAHTDALEIVMAGELDTAVRATICS
jgi:hypothetical protein